MSNSNLHKQLSATPFPFIFSINIFCFIAQARTSLSSAVEMFSVRGDGMTTAATDKPGVTAILAQASSSAYSGVILQSKSTITSASSTFYLFKVRWLCSWYSKLFSSRFFL